ncbi:MAG TPA: DsrE family protein [Burkholderiales bacterium]
MNCADAGRLLNAYADGELNLESALPIEAHLETCARCRASLEGLTALRGALSAACDYRPAPERLRARVLGGLAREAAPRAPAPAWPARLLVALPGLLALLITGWLVVTEPWKQTAPQAAARSHVVYHMASSEHAGAALRTLKNLLDAAPQMKVVVVAHNNGIDFLRRGAKDETGHAFAATLREFRARGVEFRVCTNTLTRRRIDTADIVPEAVLVPSGIAEISRLQSQLGYVYLRI